MKYLIASGMMVCLAAAPVSAARVYLKDGGVIEATSVWREGKLVQVMANRQSIATFNAAEVDLKRTFAPKPKKVSKPRVEAEKQPVPGTPAPTASAPAAASKNEGSRKKIPLPSIPSSLPEMSPEKLREGKPEGAIRKQKKEMAEKINE